MIVAFTVAVLGSLTVGFFLGYSYKKADFLNGYNAGARHVRDFYETKKKEKL